MAEYGLIGLLIVGCCAIALKTVGSELSDAMLGIVPQRPNASITMTSPTAVSGKLTFNAGSTLQIKLSNGSQMRVSPFPQDLATSVSTLGANGTTDLLANVMQSMASQMLSAGSISQEGYNHLSALSNQAHYIASIEKALEEAAAKATSNQEFSSNLITFNGKTYTPQQLRMLIGYGSGSNDTAGIIDHMNEPRAYPELKTFQTLYKQALQSGALNEPAALQVVETLASQVAYLSDVSTSATARIIQNEIPPAEMLHTMAGDISHSKSAGICHQGKGRDNGIKCSD